MTTGARTREDTTAWIGMVIFLASWALLFAALFFAYGILRVRAVEWPPAGVARVPAGVASLSTALIAASSLLLWRRRVGLAAVAGLAFLAAQTWLWLLVWRAGVAPSTGPYASVFWALSTVHAAHALIGVLALAWLALGRPRPLATRLWGSYWHFVGIVWILMYVLVVLA